MHIFAEHKNYKSSDYNSVFCNTFPNTSAVAHMDPTSQTIHLNRIDAESFFGDLKANRFANIRDDLGTIFHEITHWADLLGTVWGRSLLRKIYSAMQLIPNVDQEGCEYEYHHFLELHDAFRRLMHNEYYRTVNAGSPDHNVDRPWGIQFSVGREFDYCGRPDDRHPIPFAKFLENPSQKLVARQPIGPGALLEVNAVWSEISASFEALMMIEEEDERAVERARFINERLSYLYNPELTLYTAPAHLLAHYTKVRDVILGYEMSAALAHVVLNFSDDEFQNMILPEEFEPWKTLFEAFKNNHDVGFAYKLVSAHSSPWVEGESVLDWLDATLEKAGLKGADKILENSLKIMEAEKIVNPEGFLGKEQEYLLELGIEIAKQRKSASPQISMASLASNKLVTPPLFDSQGRMFAFGVKEFDISRFDPGEVCEISAKLQTQINKLRNACR